MTEVAPTVFVEVTNTLSVPFVTGIQRLTRELLARLPGPGDHGPVACVPVRWCAECGAYLHLDRAEADRLAHAPAAGAATPGRAAAVAGRLPAPLAGGLRRAAHSPAFRAGRDRLDGARRRRAHGALGHDARRVGPWPAGSVFFDLEAAWHDPVDRTTLLPELGAAGVVTATLVADVMPELFPEWFEQRTVDRFDRFIRAHLAHSVHFAAISECSARDLVAFAHSIGVDGPLTTSLVPMGADFPGAAPGAAPEPGRRVLLCVATLEPRKNQTLVLDAYDRLRDRHPDLAVVLVGKQGWHVDDLVERLGRHPDAGDRVRWLGQVDDDTLAALYRDAFLAVTPSLYEGFGNPVIEALAHGTPTLASSAGALPEAGGDLAEYFDPHDPAALAALVERHLDDPGHHAAARARLAGYRPPTWERSAEVLLGTLTTLASTARTRPRTR